MNLVFDADDTLWENNIYFERAFDDFCSFLNHSKLTPMQVRDVLNEIELVNAKIHGYGSKNFGLNLQQAYRHLAEREIRSDDLNHVMALAERILEQPLEVIDGVDDTLAELVQRHELTLFTKGHPEEQRMKVDRSGLGGYFAHTAIVKEKDAPAYQRLVEERGFDPSETWMIGNSPKSDINPALEAGLNAVLVPHPHTWVLEHQDLRDGGKRLKIVPTFAHLRILF
ncbi:MAG TPA: HAD hydrolase-like protein [Bryobacteraceae bacterium]|jgi:putative hydrolase of the HAD superfamily|nr:HAD hydrolase-like protein [Bryobacteraceae bacterium]